MTKYYFSLKSKLFSPINQIPASLSRAYYPSIDGLRGLAIISVILCHLATHKEFNITVDGSIGVQVFFILSGFLITTLLLKEWVIFGKVSYKKFYIRRSLRILPVAYLYIFTLIILNLIFHFGLSFENTITTIFYLKNFPLANTAETGHFWTLSVEEQFYLIVPIILISNLNRYIKIIFLLFIIVPIIDFVAFNNVGIFYTNQIVHKVTYILVSLLDEGSMYIFAGSIFSILIFKGILVVEKFKNYYFLSIVLFLIAVAIHSTLRLNIYVANFAVVSIFTVLMGFIIAINLNENNLLTKILSNRILVKIGILSYSLYIWQEIFTLKQPWAGMFKYSDNLFLNTGLLFIVAYCSYEFYEVRFLNLKKKFKTT